jgi:hypothetical protein
MRAFRLLWIPVIAVFLLSIPVPSQAQVTIGFTIGQPPPPLPVYNTIPPAPYPNYMWTPGYWAWGPAGYYWVPGTWVAPPQTGLYWTPGYWGWTGSGYGWNAGYWAPQVGFYGGVDYGFGYPGTGFYGGQWQPSGFSYNTAVWPVNTTVIHNVYINRTVINRTVIVRRTSYNGGNGGIRMSPDARELQVAHMRHVTMTPMQTAHVREAAEDRNLLASVNKGSPRLVTAPKPLSATNRPANFERVTDSDKAAAKPMVKSGGETTEHKAPMTTEHKAPMTTEHKAPMTTEHKAPMTTEHKAPATEHKAAPEHKATPAPHKQEEKKPPVG